MSGTRRLVVSEATKKGDSISTMNSAIDNSNKVAISILGKKKGKKK